MGIWGSIVFWFIFLVIYSHFWPTIKFVASNMPRMYQLIFSSGAFWFLLFLVPIATLLLDVVVAYTKFTYRPSITDRERKKKLRHHDWLRMSRCVTSDGTRLRRKLACEIFWSK